MVIKLAIIGAASNKGSQYFDALSTRNDVTIVACVVNQTMPEHLKAFGGKVIEGGDIDKLLSEAKPDVAVVTLPHHEHQRVAKKLLESGVYVIKEKPLALTMSHAKELEAIIKDKKLPPLFTTVQRTVHPAFLGAFRTLDSIGKVQSFSYNYSFALKSMTTGWRADKEKSGGGVLMDMGYHIIDIVQFFFGKPLGATAEFGYAYDEMRKKKLDDRATVKMEYDSFSGEIILDRHADNKQEIFTIVGEKGSLVTTPDGYTLNGEYIPAKISKEDLTAKLFEYCLGPDKNLRRDFQRNLDSVELIEILYKSI